MKNNLMKIAILATIMAFTGCVSSSGPQGNISAISKVAVVSFSVSDYGGSVSSGSIGSTPVADLINSTVTKMLNDTEDKLGSKWNVAKASAFINNSGYHDLSSRKTLSVFVPQINGKEMAVFTQVSKEIKGGKIDPQTAIDLCKALNVDGIVLVFSEWTSKTGGYIPLTKALTKNVLTIWDSNGRQVTKKRVDMMGKKTLGFSGVKAVNENTINEWSDSFNRAMDKIMKSI
ncbi:MAG: hypothetical protein KAS94_09070 [Desulfobulbaceae bacterium]|nr:hypothetical protein [Desulfobulbaceae bacterium]